MQINKSRCSSRFSLRPRCHADHTLLFCTWACRNLCVCWGWWRFSGPNRNPAQSKDLFITIGCFSFSFIENFIEIVVDSHVVEWKKKMWVIACPLYPVFPNGNILQNCSTVSQIEYWYWHLPYSVSLALICVYVSLFYIVLSHVWFLCTPP